MLVSAPSVVRDALVGTPDPVDTVRRQRISAMSVCRHRALPAVMLGLDVVGPAECGSGDAGSPSSAPAGATSTSTGAATTLTVSHCGFSMTLPASIDHAVSTIQAQPVGGARPYELAHVDLLTTGWNLSHGASCPTAFLVEIAVWNGDPTAQFTGKAEASSPPNKVSTVEQFEQTKVGQYWLSYTTANSGEGALHPAIACNAAMAPHIAAFNQAFASVRSL